MSKENANSKKYDKKFAAMTKRKIKFYAFKNRVKEKWFRAEKKPVFWFRNRSLWKITTGFKFISIQSISCFRIEKYKKNVEIF